MTKSKLPSSFNKAGLTQLRTNLKNLQSTSPLKKTVKLNPKAKLPQLKPTNKIMSFMKKT